MIDLRQYRANTQRRFGSAEHYHVGWGISESGRIVQAADQCDAQVIGLQNAYNGARAIIDKHNEGSSRR